MKGLEASKAPSVNKCQTRRSLLLTAQIPCQETANSAVKSSQATEGRESLVPGQKAHAEKRGIVNGIVPIIDRAQTACGLSICEPLWVKGNGLSKALAS